MKTYYYLVESPLICCSVAANRSLCHFLMS